MRIPDVYFDISWLLGYNSTSDYIPIDEGGYALLEIIENEDSPESFQYGIVLGSDRQMTAEESGGYDVLSGSYNVLDDGGSVVSLAAPWAYDANSEEVPAHYTLDNGVLTVTVDHQAC